MWLAFPELLDYILHIKVSPISLVCLECKYSLTIKLLNSLYRHIPKHSIYNSYIWSNTKQLYDLGHSPFLLFYNFNFHWLLPSIQYFWYLNNFLKINFWELYNCYHDLHLDIFIPSECLLLHTYSWPLSWLLAVSNHWSAFCLHDLPYCLLKNISHK